MQLPLLSNPLAGPPTRLNPQPVRRVLGLLSDDATLPGTGLACCTPTRWRAAERRRAVLLWTDDTALSNQDLSVQVELDRNLYEHFELLT